MQQTRYNKILQAILGDQYRVSFHILFWLFVFLDDILSVVGVTDKGNGFTYILISLLVDVCFVYFNLYYLVPKLLLDDKPGYYVFLTIISIFISLEIKFILTFPLECQGCPDGDSSALTMLVRDFVHATLLLGMALGLHIIRRFLRNQKKIQEMQTAGLMTELAFLKQQINPHFLFNALNNIYVMTRKQPEDAPEAIMRLSELLRYQLYDCAKDQVLLRNEINYLKNYLQLDKIRKSNTEVSFNVNGMANGKMIAPFMFIPFVENAVKHGLSLDSPSFIDINFDIKEEKINFSIRNSKPNRPLNTVKGGIGLVNVRRRLELLYPEKHDLLIENKNDSYKVDLEIQT